MNRFWGGWLMVGLALSLLTSLLILSTVMCYLSTGSYVIPYLFGGLITYTVDPMRWVEQHPRDHVQLRHLFIWWYSVTLAIGIWLLLGVRRWTDGRK